MFKDVLSLIVNTLIKLMVTSYFLIVTKTLDTFTFIKKWHTGPSPYAINHKN